MGTSEYSIGTCRRIRWSSSGTILSDYLDPPHDSAGLFIYMQTSLFTDQYTRDIQFLFTTSDYVDLLVYVLATIRHLSSD